MTGTVHVQTVELWHETLNANDAERLASLSHPEVGGPRGSARGRQVLKDWVGRANISLEPLRWFGRGRTVVVEEAATWRVTETGETTGEATVATVFRGGRRVGSRRVPVRQPGRSPAERGAGRVRQGRARMTRTRGGSCKHVSTSIRSRT